MAGGRPTALTKDVHDKIVAAMRAGNYLTDASAYGGVGYSTVKRWLKWGDPAYDPTADADTKNPPPRAIGKYRAFRAAVREAEAQAIVEAVAELRSAGRSDWRAAEAFLKRRASATWGTEHVAMEHSGEVAVGGPVAEALSEYADVLAELTGTNDDESEPPA